MIQTKTKFMWHIEHHQPATVLCIVEDLHISTLHCGRTLPLLLKTLLRAHTGPSGRIPQTWFAHLNCNVHFLNCILHVDNTTWEVCDVQYGMSPCTDPYAFFCKVQKWTPCNCLQSCDRNTEKYNDCKHFLYSITRAGLESIFTVVYILYLSI